MQGKEAEFDIPVTIRATEHLREPLSISVGFGNTVNLPSLNRRLDSEVIFEGILSFWYRRNDDVVVRFNLRNIDEFDKYVQYVKQLGATGAGVPVLNVEVNDFKRRTEPRQGPVPPIELVSASLPEVVAGIHRSPLRQTQGSTANKEGTSLFPSHFRNSSSNDWLYRPTVQAETQPPTPVDNVATIGHPSHGIVMRPSPIRFVMRQIDDIGSGSSSSDSSSEMQTYNAVRPGIECCEPELAVYDDNCMICRDGTSSTESIPKQRPLLETVPARHRVIQSPQVSANPSERPVFEPFPTRTRPSTEAVEDEEGQANKKRKSCKRFDTSSCTRVVEKLRVQAEAAIARHLAAGTSSAIGREEQPPAWFASYMRKFKKDIVDEVTAKVTANMQELIANPGGQMVDIHPPTPVEHRPYKHLKKAIHELKKLEKVHPSAEREAARNEDRPGAEKRERKHHHHSHHHQQKKEEKERKKCEKIARKVDKVHDKLEKKHAKRYYERARDSAPDVPPRPETHRERTESEASTAEFVVINASSSSEDEFSSVPQWGKGIVDCCSANDDSACKNRDFQQRVEKVTEELQNVDFTGCEPSTSTAPTFENQDGLFEPCDASPADSSEADIVFLPAEFAERDPAPYSSLRMLVDEEKARIDAEKAASASAPKQTPTSSANATPTSSMPPSPLPSANQEPAPSVNQERPVTVFPSFGETIARARAAASAPVRQVLSGLSDLAAGSDAPQAQPRPAPAPQPRLYPGSTSAEMDVLLEMGFENRALNAMLLERHQRNIGKTVNDLVRIYRENGQF